MAKVQQTSAGVRVGALALALLAGPAQAVVITNLPMADGVTLHTRVYLPGDDEDTPRGVILVRTPYGAQAAAEGNLFDLFQNDAAWMNQRGWAYVTQDVRGTGDSDGDDDVLRFLDDAADTDATLAWIAEQDWSSGKVAMWGPSALGIIALLALQRPSPELACVLDVVATADVREAFYPGGALREEMAVGWLPDHSGAAALDVFRAAEVDSAFWDEGRVSDAELALSEVKTFSIAGTFDVFGLGGVHTFRRLTTLSGNPDEHFLVLGPWTHDGYVPSHGADLAGAFQGELKFPGASFVFPGQPLDPGVQFTAFMRWCLDDQDRPPWEAVRAWRFWILDQPELITNLTTGGGWLSFDRWPPEESEPTPLYLYDDGGLGGAPDPLGVGRQLWSDPDDPVPTVGGARLIITGEGNGAGPLRQNALLDRDDVLVFETPPATAQASLVGDVAATVYAASSTNDIDVHVKIAVRAGGVVYLLADGVRRGRFREQETEIVPLDRGRARPFDVDLGPISFLLRPGQSLVVMVQAQNHDRFDVNPQRAVAMIDDPEPQAAALTVFTDEARPSVLWLPLHDGELPFAELPAEHADAGPDPFGGLPPPVDAGPDEEPEPGPSGCACTSSGSPAPVDGAAGLQGLLLILGAGWLRRRR